MRPFLLALSVGVALGTAAAATQAQDSVWTSKRRPRAPFAIAPLAGEYACHMLGSGGMVVTPYGAAPTVTAMPSTLVRVRLDGKSSYTHGSGSARYSWDAASGRVVVASGPFAGWSIRSESDGRGRWLRFAPGKGCGWRRPRRWETTSATCADGAEGAARVRARVNSAAPRGRRWSRPPRTPR